MTKKYIFFKIGIIGTFICVLLLALLLTSSNIRDIIKNNLSKDFKNKLKDTVFIYSTNKKLKEEIADNQKEISILKNRNKKLNYQKYFNLYYKDNGIHTETSTVSKTGERNFNKLKKFRLMTSNKSNYLNEEDFSGSFYIEKNSNNFFLNFANGNLFFFNKNDLNTNKINIKNIKNNIKSFIDNPDKLRVTSRVRDSKIINENLYISYVKKIKKSCFNISILMAKIDLNNMIFKDFFTYPECISTKIAVTGTGGRIEKIDNNKIAFSIGEQLNLFPAQDPNSIFGKIITIDLKTKKHNIIAMGNRNPQGLVYSKKNNLLFSSEHQSKGGDEVNLIKIDGKKIYNYGWPISSYGDHYDWVSEEDKKKYPLHKSHQKYGFEEPLIYFNPAIAPSEIIIEEESNSDIFFLLSTLKDKSLIELKYNLLNKEMKFIKKTSIGARIRDIYNEPEYILIAMEDNLIAKDGTFNILSSIGYLSVD